MTNREEIERLLNLTGRTLEGLPTLNEYRKRDLKTTCEAMQASGIYEAFPFIMHQSDVIELLIGALRDALDRPKNRLFTKQEIDESSYRIPCVIDEKKFGLIYGDVLNYDSDIKKYFGILATLSWAVGRTEYDIDDYGKTWRAWASRPTDEERESAAWES